MRVAKVIGTLVATRKVESLVGSKILVVQPLNPSSGAPQGAPLVAVDVVGAGVGEQVFLVEGTSARLALDNVNCPVDVSIIGIVDEIKVTPDETIPDL